MGRSKVRLVLNLLTVAVSRSVLPLVIGLEFLSAFVLIPLACLAVFLVADLVIDSFISYPGGLDSREFAGKMIACVLLGLDRRLSDYGGGSSSAKRTQSIW